MFFVFKDEEEAKDTVDDTLPDDVRPFREGSAPEMPEQRLKRRRGFRYSPQSDRRKTWQRRRNS